MRSAPFRQCAILVHDAIATVFGFYGALLLTNDGMLPADLAVDARLAVSVLVSARLAAVVLARVHCRPLDLSWRSLARLAISMIAASVVFAIGCDNMSPSVYVLELALTTGVMAAFRFAPLLASDGDEAASRPAARVPAIEGPRRVLNVLVAVVGLVLAFPVCLLIAIAIKLTSPGPVLYKQERIGLDLRTSSPLVQDPRRKRDLGGRPFMMYKFRTMRVDAEQGTGAVWASKRDPRVTAIGGLLRHCRLDELPQLLNVIKGDMNIVGPRPERPSIFADLRAKIPQYAVRQRARPGITGYAQVNLEADTTIEDVAEKLRYDLDYVSQQSVATDLRIMAKTIPVMLFRDRMLSARERRATAADAADSLVG